MASRFDSATSASTWSEPRSAIVTTALLEKALAASGATTSPTSPVAYPHTEVDEPARALRGDGGLPLCNDVPARDEDGARTHRRHHGRGRQAHGERRTEGAPGNHEDRTDDQDGSRGQADQEPAPGAPRRPSLRGLGRAVDPQGREVRVLGFHRPQS